MANEIRLRRNNLQGTITNNPLAQVSTTINSAGFVDLPTIAGTNSMILILDPLEVNGPAEIVLVTAHTAAASSVTVTRGVEGSAARAHILGTTWFHGPVTSDFTEVLTSGTRPTIPYTGEPIYETDTLKNMRYSGTAWGQDGLLFDPPAAICRRNVVQSINNATWTLVTFDTEDLDTNSMFTVGSGDRITIVTGGLYNVTFKAGFIANVTQTRLIQISRGVVADTNVFARAAMNAAATDSTLTVSGLIALVPGDTLSFQVFQNSGGALNTEANVYAQPRASAIWVGRGNAV